MAARRGWLLLWLALPALAAAPVPDAFNWHLPRGFPTPYVPADNPMSVAKVELGRRLFHDPQLSLTGRYACASCHDPARAYSDGRALAVGATGQTLPRNALPLVNVVYNLAFGWQTPGLTSLEAQMRQPLFNRHPVEIGLAGREAALLAYLAADAQYRRQFAQAFGAPATVARMIQAIAAFERTLIGGRSPFDAYVFAGDHQALSAVAKQGMALFFSARLGCAGCHFGINFAGNWRDSQGATGPAVFADDGLGIGAVRVPTLRNLALTAPYMHDGRYASLDEVLDHYQRVGHLPDSGHGGARDPRLRPFILGGAERQALKAFLLSLTDAPPAAP